jgi:phosphoribosylformylglycinamidine synthase
VAAWFSESASRVIVAVAPDRVAAVVDRARAAGVPVTELGDAGGDRLIADGAFDVPLAAATAAWRDAIPAALSPATAG